MTGALADQRDGGVGAEQPMRSLGIGGELHQAHRASDRLALELAGHALAVAALEHLRHRRRNLRRQAEPLGEQAPHLAVPAWLAGIPAAGRAR